MKTIIAINIRIFVKISEVFNEVSVAIRVDLSEEVGYSKSWETASCNAGFLMAMVIWV
jgi:hypothetical protein